MKTTRNDIATNEQLNNVKIYKGEFTLVIKCYILGDVETILTRRFVIIQDQNETTVFYKDDNGDWTYEIIEGPFVILKGYNHGQIDRTNIVRTVKALDKDSVIVNGLRRRAA